VSQSSAAPPFPCSSTLTSCPAATHPSCACQKHWHGSAPVGKLSFAVQQSMKPLGQPRSMQPWACLQISTICTHVHSPVSAIEKLRSRSPLLILPFTKATKVLSAFLCSLFAATNNLHQRFPRVGDPQGQEDTHHEQWCNLPAFAEQDAAPGGAEDKCKTQQP
jgi:hypothetical protein